MGQEMSFSVDEASRERFLACYPAVRLQYRSVVALGPRRRALSAGVLSPW